MWPRVGFSSLVLQVICPVTLMGSILTVLYVYEILLPLAHSNTVTVYYRILVHSKYFRSMLESIWHWGEGNNEYGWRWEGRKNTGSSEGVAYIIQNLPEDIMHVAFHLKLINLVT
jgi:hypothetical protein